MKRKPCRGAGRAARARPHAVMLDHLLIGGVEVGFVAASAADAGLGVVGHHQFGHAV